MKQKYIILKDSETNKLFIKEFNEVDKDILSLVCDCDYAGDIIKSAIANGKNALIETLRTEQFYPPAISIHQIADSIIELYESDSRDSIELFFDDKDSFVQEEKPEDFSEDINELEKNPNNDS